MRRSVKIILPVAIVLAGFLLMQLFLSMRKDSPRRTPTVREKHVEAMVVRLTDQTATVKAYGRIKSSQPIALVSEVSGLISDGSRPFKPAQSFKKGDLLLKVDDRQTRYSLNSLKSNFLTALASVLPEIKLDFPQQYQIWQEYFDRCSFDKNLTPLPEADNPRIKMFLARFNIYNLYYQIKNLEVTLEKHYFYAPFDGSIVSADFRAGSNTRVGMTLGQIINLQDLEVEVELPAEDMIWIDRSHPVKLTSNEIEGQWEGQVSRIGSNINNNLQTVQCFIKVDRGNTQKLINGLFLQVEIPGKIIANSSIIPRKSVYDENSVYLISSGKLESRPVKIARREENTVIITDGLQEGDTLVTEVLQGVSTGMPARPSVISDENGSTQ